MGTSSSYKGLSGKPNLLPVGWESEVLPLLLSPDGGDTSASPEGENGDWTEEQIDKGKELIKEFRSGCKRAITKMSSNFDKDNYNKTRYGSKIYRNYAKSYGGSKIASKKLIKDIGKLISFGKFLSDISSSKISEQTLKKYGFDFQDKNVYQIMNEMVLHFAPVGNDRDDSIIRKSFIITIESMISLSLIDQESVNFDSLSKNDFNNLMITFYENFVLLSLFNDYPEKFETLDCTKAINLENEIRDYVHETIMKNKSKFIFSNLDFDSDEISQNLLKMCEEIIELLGDDDE